MNTLDLLRPEIRTLTAYKPADYIDGMIRLNANESPWRPPGDTTRDGLNRYPSPKPEELTARLEAHYGVGRGQLLVTRGSSEAIDVLIRGFCRAGRDELVICPPTFGMYEVYGRIQGALIRALPLDPVAGFGLPVAGILAGWQATTRLVFVCSPNNPTGNSVSRADLERLCSGLAGRGVVVLDAAYREFAGDDDTPGLLARYDNLVILRTLSKALGLAGVRCGALLGCAPLVELLGRVLPPYCFPSISQEAVLRALDPEASAVQAERRAVLVRERARVSAALNVTPGIRRVWPSTANFVLVQTDDPAVLLTSARSANILVRDFSSEPQLTGCIRITIGTPAENDLLLKALDAA
jgi:histidinol-phosphate aminotransferase